MTGRDRVAPSRGSTGPQSILVAAHAWYGDVIGGSFRLASEFAQSLAEAGDRVTYVCCAPEGGEVRPARETISGVDVRRYPALAKRRSGWGRMQYHVRQTAALVSEVLREGPVDAISGHSPLQTRGAVRAARGRDAYINYTVHSPFDDELQSNWGEGRDPRMAERLAVRAARSIDRRNLKAADRVQTDSRYTLDVLADRHGAWVRTKGVVAPGWVDVDRFRPVENRRAVRRATGVTVGHRPAGVFHAATAGVAHGGRDAG